MLRISLVAAFSLRRNLKMVLEKIALPSVWKQMNNTGESSNFLKFCYRSLKVSSPCKNHHGAIENWISTER